MVIDYPAANAKMVGHDDIASLPASSPPHSTLSVRQTPNSIMSSMQSNAPPGKESSLRLPSNGKTIYHRPLNRTKAGELSQASFAYLFGEMVTYAQRRVKGIQELEQR